MCQGNETSAGFVQVASKRNKRLRRSIGVVVHRLRRVALEPTLLNVSYDVMRDFYKDYMETLRQINDEVFYISGAESSGPRRAFRVRKRRRYP